MRTIEVAVYKFSELPEKSKEAAISGEIEFMMEIRASCLRSFIYEHSSDNFKKAVDTAEEMQTPWFTGSYIYEFCKNEIIEFFEDNEFEFTIEGKMA